MDELKHIGTKRHSGRYPWGSGKAGYQRSSDFLSVVKDLKSQGKSKLEIAKALEMNTSDLQKSISIATARKRAGDAAMAQRLKEKGYSNVAIGKRMNINESSVRSLLDPYLRVKAEETALTAQVLRDNVEEKKYIDVGTGIENHMGISRTKLNTAVYMLEQEGYTVHYIDIEQVGTGKYTKMKVLAPPGTEWSEVRRNASQIKTITDYSEDGGHTFLGIEPPRSVSSDRVFIRYGEEGGSAKDGTIELKRGVDDLYFGDKRYAQVRIAVDDDKYMKGMAFYSDEIPKGYDIVYNVNKKRGTPDADVFKSMKDDPDNPFGAMIRQKHYTDADGKTQLSAINVVGYVEGGGEEGSWRNWSRNISSQILSKQDPHLAKEQLGLAYKMKQDEYDEIMSLTNPSVKKALLMPFADSCDSAAVHLQAAALPRQNTHVLLPVPSLKDNEVYAPNYENGETVVLLRHPHGGIFEIPELKVNNRNTEGKSIIGDAIDAVGINPNVAKKLSGADFDGDTVIVIPNRNKKIASRPSLETLKDFDPKKAYPKYDGMTVMTDQKKQLEMGKISNLITDMTIKGATEAEIASAVKHSMVVIDAEKHKLNYEQSYYDNGIPALKEKYQGGKNSGASTLISKAGAKIRIPQRKEGVYETDPVTGKSKRVYIDPNTGEKLYTKTGKTYPERKKVKDPVTGKSMRDPVTGKVLYVYTGKIKDKMQKVKRMEMEKDAYKLSSGSIIEGVYADHANGLKAMANKARLAMLATNDIPYSRSARETYSKEVDHLKAQLVLAYRNKPQERQAQLLANKIIAAKRRDNPDMSEADLKKIKGQALEEARFRSGAKKHVIEINDREWDAIQSGAVSPTTLNKILANTDTAKLKQRAMPRTAYKMTPVKVQRARAMALNGASRAEIAGALGVSVTTIINTLND